MSGETDKLPSGWTTDTLNYYFQKQLDIRFPAERDYEHGLVDVIKQRIDAIDKATELLNAQVTATPTEVDKRVGHLEQVLTEVNKGSFAVVIEKIAAIYLILAEREKRTAEAASLADTALKAAFKAQQDAATEQNKANEKAIAVSARSTQETILKNEQIATNGIAGLESRFTELKDSVSEVRADIRGLVRERAGGATNLSQVVAIIAVLATIVLGIYAVVRH